MDQEGSGFGSSPYEYIVTEQKGRANRARRVLLILGYVLYILILLMLGVTIRLIVPFLCLMPLSLWILVFFTWRFTQTEYRISFQGGILTVTRFFGGRNPREVVKLSLKELCHVRPYTEDEERAIKKRDLLLRATDGSHGRLCLLSLETGKTMLLRLDEKAERLIRKYNWDCFEP